MPISPTKSSLMMFAQRPLSNVGGVGSFQRADADLQYLSLVAASALEKEPHSLLLLVAPTDTDPSKKDQTGVFLLAGPAGDVILVLFTVQICNFQVHKAYHNMGLCLLLYLHWTAMPSAQYCCLLPCPP